MNWIADSTKLQGETIELLPLAEHHFAALVLLAQDKRIWEFIPADMSNDAKVHDKLSAALSEKEKGTQFPFVIFHKPTQKIIGSTRLMDIQPAHRKLEIGWTWLHTDHWATRVNPECKLLLLTFCFEELKALRVQLKTDENNIRSRTAIQKIGARFEGILRNDMIRENGSSRNSAYYSIVDTEWKAAKEKLEALKNKL